MRLRDVLADFERTGAEDRRFPGERRTTNGRFTGGDGRLVHVDTAGGLRDFGSPLTGQHGLAWARFGVAVDDDVTWFDDDHTESRYVEGVPLVETTHRTDRLAVRRHDLTVGDTHLTRAVLDAPAAVAADRVSLVIYAAFAPDGREERIGQLRFDDAVEVYHADEHDFLASATGLTAIRGRRPLDPADLLADPTAVLPDDNRETWRDEQQLSGEVLVDVPFEDGVATVATLLTDQRETDRETARSRLETRFDELDSVDALVTAAGETVPSVPEEVPARAAVTADLTVLSLLSAPNGLRMAGPDFDPHYLHSGGYGYTWFRDDAEIAGFLLAADEQLGLGLDDWHARSAQMYVATQLPDGSWPHRVWPHSGALAPGWANGRIEATDSPDYQADQTASVVAFLARARDAGVDVDGLDAAIVRGLASLDESLAIDGRPVVCQNAWEDAIGRFTHTAATFLEAYSAVAVHAPDLEAGVAADVADRFETSPAAHARDRAGAVYRAIDDLWVPGRGSYAVSEAPRGGLDERLDAATLALVSAHRAYDRLEADGAVDDDRLDRLTEHVETVVDGLTRETDTIRGLVRYEGDTWRQDGQNASKVWTVSTAWGAHACGELAALLADRGDPRSADIANRARDLLACIAPRGPLCAPTGYLPEQFFDDGTPDSATPLGWPHAIRLATVGLLYASDRLAVDELAASR